MNQQAQYWIKKLALKKHPEGGFYHEVYRSNELIQKQYLPARYLGDRCLSTSIYFLLSDDDFSAFHRVNSDEIWHFHAGTSLTLYVINPKGELTQIVLSNELNKESVLQYAIPENYWFAARVNDPQSYALISCTVSPGFEFEDFQLAKRSQLINLFPQHKNIITQLTRE